MALNIYSTPAMSDAPERVFSIAGNVYSSRRETLTQDTVQEVLYLRSWQESGILDLTGPFYETAIVTAENAPVNGDLMHNDSIFD
jgi:hypothetical protein